MKVPNIQELSVMKCKPCAGDMRPFSQEEAVRRVSQVLGWRVSDDGKSIWREYVMKDFLSAVSLIDVLAQVAEAEDHHPDLNLSGYRKLRIDLSTHSIGGLSENDFILAAKIEQLPKSLKQSA